MTETRNILQRKVQLHAVIDAETKERMKREARNLGLTLAGYVNFCTLFYQDSVEEGRAARKQRDIVIPLPPSE